jgi:hypothetical protein
MQGVLGADFMALEYPKDDRQAMDSRSADCGRMRIHIGQRRSDERLASGPNCVRKKILGIAVVFVPYGNSDAANHAPNETLTIDGFIIGI